MAESDGPRGGRGPLPPVTLADMQQALDLTEARIRWLEGSGALPRAERDPEGRLLWDVTAVQAWAKTDAGQKLIATLR